MTRTRLLALAITDEQILGRLERGSLRSIHAGVYATFGTPLDHRARVLAACLAAGEGAVASHRSALSLWGLLDGEQPIDVTAPRSSHPDPDRFVLHRPNVLRPMDVTVQKHVPITNPMRSLLDAGVELPASVVGECVERALTNRLVTVKGLRVILDWYSIATGEAQGARGLSFVVLSTASEAAAVRVTTSTATARPPSCRSRRVASGGLWCSSQIPGTPRATPRSEHRHGTRCASRRWTQTARL